MSLVFTIKNAGKDNRVTYMGPNVLITETAIQD